MIDIGACYRLLDVKPGANPDDVKRAYYDLVRKWHPDQFQQDDVRKNDAEEKLKKINVAYGRLQKHVAEAAARAKSPDRTRPEWGTGPTGYDRASGQRAYARTAGVKTAGEEPAPSAERAHALYEVGKSQFLGGQWKEAVSSFVQSVCLYPNNGDAHLTLGLTYRMMNMPAKAVAALKQAVRFDPDSEEAQRNLGETCLEVGEFREAIWYSAQYLKRNAGSPGVLANLGAGYRRSGKIPQAQEALLQAVSIDPNYARAHYELGETQLMMGDISSARQTYNTLRVLNDDLAVSLLLAIVNK